MKLVSIFCLACFWLASDTLHAQEAGKPQGQDPIAEFVLPPELIMQHQKAISLSEAQKTAVIAEIKKVQGRLIDVQWDMQRAVERMVELLRQEKVDEQAVIAQLDNVLAVEREVKRAQLGLAVRLKNMLNPEQQRMLRELRAGAAPAGAPPPRR